MAANPDSIDRHERRGEIEEALAKGAPVRQVAEVFSLSKSAVHRHKERMAREMAGAAKAGDTRADELLDRVKDLQQQAESILKSSRRNGDHRTALAAIKESRSTLELLAKMLGELQAGTVVNITVSHQWISLRADLMVALEPFPDARVAVIRALEKHEPDE